MTDGRGVPPPPATRAGPLAAVTAVTAALLLLLVLLVAVWAAVAGPDEPFRGTGTPPDRVPAPTQTTDTEAADSRPREEGREGDGASLVTRVIGGIVLVVGVLVGLGVLWFLAHALRQVVGLRLQRRRREPESPALDPVEAVRSAMVADARVQEDLLSAGTPRNAVVQCWHRFEVQAARAGVPRQPWETSAEYTLRLLELVEADAHSVARLAELYREARFSEHELDEGSRAVALEVLRAIHRDLRTLLSGGRL